MMKSLAFNLAEPDWLQAKWEKALCRVPALLAALAAGLWFHQPAGGVVAAGAAFSVGLVGERKVAGSSFWAMAATALVMAFSACVGTLSGNSIWFNPMVTALWGLAFAFVSIQDDDSGWIFMQSFIVLVIASTFPAQGLAALGRGLAIGAGGFLQIAVLALVAFSPRLFGGHEAVTTPVQAAVKSSENFWSQIFGSMKVPTAWHYALRVAVTMMIAVEAGRALHIQNGYWLPMTTIIVLKPDFYRTYSGAVQRVAGTFIGVGVASLVAHLFRPAPEFLFVLVALFSFCSFMFVKVHPILFSTVLTAYIVFLIAFTGLPETQITWHRLFLTALGSAVALSSRAIGYHRLLRLFQVGTAPVPVAGPRPQPTEHGAHS